MAIVANTLIGRASGSVGNATFSQWKGLNILKAKIAVMTNPRSSLQQANRARFVALLGFAKLWRPILQFGFKEYAGRMSWMNRFMSVNCTNGFVTWDNVESAWITNPSLLVIAEGSLFPTPFVVSDADTASIVVDFAGTATNNQATNDRVFVLASTKNETKFMLGTVTRADGSATIPLTGGMVGDDYFVSVFFVSNDGRIVSNSITLTGTLAAP